MYPFLEAQPLSVRLMLMLSTVLPVALHICLNTPEGSCTSKNLLVCSADAPILLASVYDSPAILGLPTATLSICSAAISIHHGSVSWSDIMPSRAERCARPA